MRFHLLGLPNAPVHEDFSLDGFAVAGHRFARMLKKLGHHVTLYGAEGSDSGAQVCDEFVPIIRDHERRALLGDCEYQHAFMDEGKPLWQRSNAAAAAEIQARKKPRDFLLTIGGASQLPVFQFHPDLTAVEYSIGYTGSFCANRVFESRCWQHCTYGFQNISDGRFFDTVIPLFFDPAQFKFEAKPDDYFLYVGRLVARKGVMIACQAAQAAGVKLKIIGHGDPKQITYGEYLGAVDWKTRNEVMSKAKAVFTPTMYLEPFGATAVEAQMCGTPVISTDFGAFTETVEHGLSGFRCNYLGEFVRAAQNIESLDRSHIAARAWNRYSMWNVMHEYERYFKRLNLLWEAGWNSL